MREIVCALLLLSGAAFMLLSAVGILRMPDLYMRMSAATKASTLGAAAMMLAAAVYFGESGITARAVATIIFLLLTAPIAAHMIGRAAYFTGVPLWEKTKFDELAGRYDAETHELSGEAKTLSS